MRVTDYPYTRPLIYPDKSCRQALPCLSKKKKGAWWNMYVSEVREKVEVRTGMKVTQVDQILESW